MEPLSNTDTNGAEERVIYRYSVLISEVQQEWYLGLEVSKVSFLEGCLQFRGGLIISSGSPGDLGLILGSHKSLF